MSPADVDDELEEERVARRGTRGDRAAAIAQARAGVGAAAARGGAERRKRATHLWARRIHVYTSMFALLLVLFFGITGITLNHPSWTFGTKGSRTEVSGTFPFDPVGADGAIDFLSAAEYARSAYDVVGAVDSHSVVGTEGSIAFKNPGYAADLFFDTSDGSFRLVIEQQGFVAVMNDLHKGRDAGTAWRWVIDVAAGFLVVISLTGIVMQLFLRRRRTAAFVSAGVGAAATVVFVVLTLT